MFAPATGYAEVGKPSVTVKTLCGPVTLQVHELEEQRKALEELCGSIIATLRVNRLRETLISADDKQLDELIDSWSRQLSRCVGHNAAISDTPAETSRKETR